MKLIFADEALAAFDKPSGLLVHRGWGDADLVAVDIARETIGARVFPVHRLDRATSGVLLFALTSEDARALHEQMEHHDERTMQRAKKRYLALVRGVPPEAGEIDHPIPRREGGPRVPAKTTYKRIHVFERYAIVEAFPETGRLHQVRRHMKHISHPLIGDVNYGKGEHNRLFRERFGLCRLALHCASMEVTHPRTEARVRFEAALPEDLARPFAAMGFSLSSAQR